VALPYPSALKYTKTHAWVKAAGPYARIGITDYGQRQVGDVVYIDFPCIGEAVDQGQWFGTIESTDAVFELYSPVSGEIVRVNDVLRRRPEAVNEDPHGSWIVAVKLKKSTETAVVQSAVLMDAERYARYVDALCHQW